MKSNRKGRPERSIIYMLAVLAGAAASGASAQDNVGQPAGEAGKPNPLKNVYFGEQHLHTVNSPDAFAFGTRNTPDDALRFCKGEEITLQTTGEKHKKKRPMTGARLRTMPSTWA